MLSDRWYGARSSEVRVAMWLGYADAVLALFPPIEPQTGDRHLVTVRAGGRAEARTEWEVRRYWRDGARSTTETLPTITAARDKARDILSFQPTAEVRIYARRVDTITGDWEEITP